MAPAEEVLQQKKVDTEAIHPGSVIILLEAESSPGVVLHSNLERIKSNREGNSGNSVEDVKTWCQR